MKKKELRKDFLWGAALSNVQAEGGYLEDGKGLNVYDTLVVTPEPGIESCLLYTSPSPRDRQKSRMPSSA